MVNQNPNISSAQWSSQPASREDFVAAYQHGRDTRKVIGTATSPTDELPGHDANFYLHPDRQSGYYEHDRYVGGLFSTQRGRGNELVQSVVARGGGIADHFDGHLTDLYERHGADTYATEKNWTPGEPDVHFINFKAKRPEGTWSHMAPSTPQRAGRATEAPRAVEPNRGFMPQRSVGRLAETTGLPQHAQPSGTPVYPRHGSPVVSEGLLPGRRVADRPQRLPRSA